MSDLSVSCRITTPEGTMEINDGIYYTLADTSFAASAQQWRRQDIQSPYLDGTYTVSAVRENVSINVSVYVNGVDHGDMERKLKRLTDAFTQFRYMMTVTRDDHIVTRDCQVADYQIDSRREFQHAKMCLATFTVPAHPQPVGT